MSQVFERDRAEPLVAALDPQLPVRLDPVVDEVTGAGPGGTESAMPELWLG